MQLINTKTGSVKKCFVVTYRSEFVGGIAVEKGTVFVVKGYNSGKYALTSKQYGRMDGIVLKSNIGFERFRFAYKNEVKLCK